MSSPMRGGCLTSVPGAATLTLKVPEGSVLPDELRGLGYDLLPSGPAAGLAHRAGGDRRASHHRGLELDGPDLPRGYRSRPTLYIQPGVTFSVGFLARISAARASGSWSGVEPDALDKPCPEWS